VFGEGLKNQNALQNFVREAFFMEITYACGVGGISSSS